MNFFSKETNKGNWMRVTSWTTIVYMVFIGLPIFALVLRGLGSQQLINNIFSDLTLQALRLSFITSSISILAIVLFATPTAYYLSRKAGNLKRIIEILIDLPIVLPPVVAGVAMLMAFGRNGLLSNLFGNTEYSVSFTTLAVILAQIFVAAPFYTKSASNGFAQVPRELEDISQTLGMTPIKTFWKITLPIASPTILGGLALSWARALSEFGATLMFAGNFIGKTQTMPLAILSAMETDFDAAIALSIILLIASTMILVILTMLGQRSNSVEVRE